MELPFQFITDHGSSDRLEGAFSSYWPAYQRWIARSSTHDPAICLAQLTHHMPELVPTYQQLHARFGGTEAVGRFLTLFNPPRVVRACTQLIYQADDGPRLLRSYDHDPRLIDGIILRSEWGGTQALAMTDCLWGALDGINSHGLAIALAFGGRNVIGDGFLASLICRYVLQTCENIADARAALARVPVSMPYTFAVLDAEGEFVTAFLGPDTDAVFVTKRASSNHQRGIEWPEYARFSGSAERLERIETLLDPEVTSDQARLAFLSPPVWRTEYAKASGTLYVAEYAPASKSLRLHWPDRSERFDFAQAPDRAFRVVLPEPAIK